ncbi:cupin-like domain-containing protein [Archangium violaceum]|uniref:cupin-like domain-containing protein n=1 Tax=Archangium violaceum TaxID=83451 RepID=UPI00193AF788|nr:cupin-like domain-containing protein [Archangium violaceum]QRK06190.1 cupin-like domain-containing protein [Archangium violaceum]
MHSATSRLSPEWQQWLAENLAQGASLEEVATTLRAAGVSEEVAREEVAAADQHPFVRAGRGIARRYARMESLMDVYSALHRQAGHHRGVEKRAGLSAEEFFTRYYFGHRPVVLQGLMEDWPALRRWSLDYIRETCGEAEVEIMSGRDANPNHSFEHDRHRSTVRMAEFVRMITEAGETNDFYMVPRNDNWQRDGLRALREDIRAPSGIIDPSLDPRSMTLLLGPAGTVTPLHHDKTNVLLGQVLGRKHCKLIPSFQPHRVYPRDGTFSHVDASNPDPTLHPAYLEAHCVEVVLEPGELIFIPVGWWHWVRALDVSASVTFLHFQLPEGNTYMEFPA